MAEPHTSRRKRLDERIAPGWANLATNLLRGGGLVVGLVVLWLGLVTGGFFLVLAGVLAVIAIAGGWLLGGLIQRESWYESSNAQLKTWALVIGFPVVLLVFAQVVGPWLTPEPTKAACFSGTPARNGELHTQLAVDPRIKSMEFTVQVTDISGGAVRWFVQDPAGQSRWSGREETPGIFSSDAMPGSGGQWTINLISEADALTYNVEWRSLDPMATEAADFCLKP